MMKRRACAIPAGEDARRSLDLIDHCPLTID